MFCIRCEKEFPQYTLSCSKCGTELNISSIFCQHCNEFKLESVYCDECEMLLEPIIDKECPFCCIPKVVIDFKDSGNRYHCKTCNKDFKTTTFEITDEKCLKCGNPDVEVNVIKGISGDPDTIRYYYCKNCDTKYEKTFLIIE